MTVFILSLIYCCDKADKKSVSRKSNILSDVNYNKEGEYSGNEEKVRLYLNLYNNKQVKCFIQPPCNNTQTFSHIHGFILDTIPDDVANAYRDINMVVKIKEDLITTPTESVLSRTMTNA